MIYLDHAATTPVTREVADTMYDVLLNGSGNPSSQYPYGAAAKKRLEADRAVIAAALGCKPDELYFTSCGTESDNWAIRLAAHQNRRVGKHIITTAVEHSAVLEPCRQLEQEGYAVTYLAPDRQGNITAQQVADALREDTALVSVMLVNNETGCVFPVGEIARLLRERGSRALLHTDAVQAFLKLPFRADTLGADLISVSGHKLNAPKGVGALYIGPRCRAVRPLLAALPTWDDETLLASMKELAERLEVKNAKVMWPVRIAVSGRAVTPGGAVEICRILGRDETLRRIDAGIAKLEG